MSENTNAEKELPVPLVNTVPSLKDASRASELEIGQWGRVHSGLMEHLSGTSFQIQDEMMLFPRPRWVSIQVVSDTRYRSEGRLRAREDHCYFSYTLEGRGTVTTKHGTYQVAAGQGFLVEIDDPDSAYFYPPNAHEPWRFLAFTFVGLPAKAMVRALTERHGPHYTLDPQTPILRRLIAQQPRELGIANISVSDGARMVLDLLAVLADAAEAHAEVIPEKEMVKKAMQIMETDAARCFQVAELAAAVGVSREHLARAFQRHIRQTPSQFLRTQKMQRACFLLKGSAISIPQVAVILGYTDSTNFIHAFRQAVGMTPHQFRLHGRLNLMSK